MDLLSFERKLDSTIMRKRLDIQEALKRPMKVCFESLPEIFLFYHSNSTVRYKKISLLFTFETILGNTIQLSNISLYL